MVDEMQCDLRARQHALGAADEREVRFALELRVGEPVARLSHKGEDMQSMLDARTRD